MTFTQDVETAAAVNRGELSAQAAFMTGRLRVGGDVQVLLDRQPALAEVDDIFAPSAPTRPTTDRPTTDPTDPLTRLTDRPLTD